MLMRGLLGGIVAVFMSASAHADGDPMAISYEKHVAPLLRQHCYKCHAGTKQTADLRLDVRSRAFAGGSSGIAAIVAGKADQSELYRRIVSHEPDVVMPPKKPIPAADIQTIKVWINAGAKWPDSLSGEAERKHWAFETPTRPSVPVVPSATHPIDAFVGAKLIKEGLKPSQPADRATLARRVALDLTGLPPTVKQLDAFLNDRAANAYEKYVETMLASPHFGERWGRLWLDAARYADSDGFEKDKPRAVWFYRDWVIRAFNDDLPYDQFLTEQLAGDLLPKPTQSQLVATGFLRNSMINEEGGVDPEQFRMEAMFDRMDAIGKAMLGLTIQCAQCHTHKYDPITHADYYRLFAYLNNSHEGNIAVYSPTENARRAEIFEQVKTLNADWKHRTPDWEKRLNAWAKSQRGTQPAWASVKPIIPDETTGGCKYLPQPDGSFLAQSYAPTKHGVRLEWTTPTEIRALRLELLNDANLPRGGPGRSIEGTAALTEFEVSVGPPDATKPITRVKVESATADVNMTETPLKAIYEDKSKRKRVVGPIGFAIDGKDETAWSHDTDPKRRNQPRQAVFGLKDPIPAGSRVQVVLRQNHGGWNSDDNQNYNLGRFRLSSTNTAGATADLLPPSVRAIIDAKESGAWSDSQKESVFAAFLASVPEGKDARATLDALYATYPEGTTQLVYTERTATRPTMILKRGDFLKPGDAVEPGVPEFLPKPSADLPPNRLGLAKWLTDPKHATTSRAAVNRLWQTLFGTGLVASSEDLGTQADTPSHPELLDWLATEYPARGWSTKQMLKLILMSNTYQQSSRVSPELLAQDPVNRLLARGARFRVDAELVRDIALSASGLLNPTVGGPSVYPPVPAFLMLPPASYGPKVWPEDTGADRYRRSIYIFRYRSVPYPALQAFDAPNGDFSCVKRSRSNTPLQALTAMNEPIFVESARALARQILRDADTDAARLDYAFKVCLSRAPTQEESAVLMSVYAAALAKYSDPSADPWAVSFARHEDYKLLPNTTTPAQLAAWVTIARVMLNLDEMMTKE